MDQQAETSIEDALRRLGSNLPGLVRHRLLNSLTNFAQAARLIDLDPGMAAFRALTGEEEAATALIKAVQFRKYEHANNFKHRDHFHKAAVMACVGAVATTVRPLLGEFKLLFDFRSTRVDLRVPLRALAAEMPDDYAFQPVEPLGMTFTREGLPRHELYSDALAELAAASSFEGIRKMVSAAANERNLLLYASDGGPPICNMTSAWLNHRKRRAQVMLVVAVMVLQTRQPLPMVQEAILAFLGVIAKLPTTIAEPEDEDHSQQRTQQ